MLFVKRKRKTSLIVKNISAENQSSENFVQYSFNFKKQTKKKYITKE